MDKKWIKMTEEELKNARGGNHTTELCIGEFNVGIPREIGCLLFEFFIDHISGREIGEGVSSIATDFDDL